MIKRLLIANRGEIARRIIKTCHKHQIKAIAIYSDTDKDAPFVKEADEAYPLCGITALETYLNIEKIIDIAKKHQICAIHPGYGFLSENADFAKALQKANITFVGPDEKALEIMGSKSKAKALVIPLGVPTIPGFHGKEQSLNTLMIEAKKMGFPILIKAAFGGGGKGMRVVHDESELEESILSAKRESLKGFAKDDLILEKYLEAPRHIEVQIVRDSFNNCLHFFDRDCSLQRRHQKVVEEAPALELSDTLKDEITKHSKKIADAINYQGAGTLEFLVDKNNQLYFIEMNTRLQVEHPVSELITKKDLVYLQLLVASGKALPLTQQDIKANGHAIEVRVYAEDASNQFLPATGKIDTLIWPKENEFIRIDSGIEKGNVITHYFDPMLAKIISCGQTRYQALNNLLKALDNTVIVGVKTNIAFLRTLTQSLINDENLPRTDYLEITDLNQDDNHLLAYALYACFYYQKLDNSNNPWLQNPAWQLNLDNHFSKMNIVNDEALTFTLSKRDSFTVLINQTTFVIDELFIEKNQIKALINNAWQSAYITDEKDKTTITLNGQNTKVTSKKHDVLVSQGKSASLNAPMPGTLVSVNVNKDDSVISGQVLAILEAMKMEHPIKSPSDGIIKSVCYEMGQTVNEGDVLFELED